MTEFLQEKKIKSISDVGCGDFNWMSEIDLKGISYTGYDWVFSKDMDQYKSETSKQSKTYKHYSKI